MSLYTQAKRCCDLVLKGGVTSGVLYPPAICRIAEGFYLIGIGGTSAGAIAACTAAAAEYRRRQYGDGEGFKKLENLPDMLAGEGNLTALFRPDGSTKKIYSLFLEALALKELSKLRRLGWNAKIAWAWLHKKKHLGRVVANGFGLCTGMANDNQPGAGEIKPLTEWLSDIIDDISGIESGDSSCRPLTFGDLRHAKIPPSLAVPLKGLESRSIDLSAVTTCISFGRPLKLPFDKHRIFAFDPDEWRLYFPAKVVNYMIEVAEGINAPSLKQDGKLPFPVGDLMPVVVAARMSLSFPFLFTMIPLYAVNYDDPLKPLMKVWFSDGGITSNLPIHQFDSLFPRWPTLAINLQYTGEDGMPTRSGVGEDMIYMIKRLADGTNDLWNVFYDNKSPLKDLAGFASAIFRSAQVWHDNAYLRLPGYRDRVVEIWLNKNEGGMNLNMPEETIRSLIERGNQAGIQLRARFLNRQTAEKLSWDCHRWTRLRSALAGLAVYLNRFKQSTENPMEGDRTLSEFLESKDAPPAYTFGSKQYNAAKESIEELIDYINKMESKSVCEKTKDSSERPFCNGPDPSIEIGSRAPI